MIPRSCRAVFRHDVARFAGVLLTLVSDEKQAAGQSFIIGLGLHNWFGAGPAQAFAIEIDAMRVVNEPIENRVGIGWIADDLVPFVDRDLAGQDGRAATVAFFEDFVEIASGTAIERVETPIVEDEELRAIEASHDARMTAVAAGRRGRAGKIAVS